MRNIFNSFTGSFFRTIGRILAYAAIGLILAYFAGFINIGNVKAQTTLNYNNFKQSTYVMFSNCVSTGDCWHTLSTTSSGGLAPVWDVRNLTITSNGPGALVLFETDTGFIKGNYYTVGFFIDNNANVQVVPQTTNDFAIGTGTPSYQSYVNRTKAEDFGGTGNLVFSFNYDIDGTTKSLNLSEHGSFVTYTFKAPANGSWFMGTFRTVSNVTNGLFTFYGYTVTNHGSKAPTTEEIEEALQDQFDSLNNSITEGFEDITGAVDGVGDKVQDTNDKLDDLNDNITDTDTSGSEDLAGGFFEGFDNEDYGLSDIITMPLQVINNITSATCSPLELPLPFVDTDVTLPCMYDIYEDHFGGFLTIYQTITFGIVSYWVCINIFRMVKNFKNPDNDEVEVLDL